MCWNSTIRSTACAADRTMQLRDCLSLVASHKRNLRPNSVAAGGIRYNQSNKLMPFISQARVIVISVLSVLIILAKRFFIATSAKRIFARIALISRANIPILIHLRATKWELYSKLSVPRKISLKS